MDIGSIIIIRRNDFCLATKGFKDTFFETKVTFLGDGKSERVLCDLESVKM